MKEIIYKVGDKVLIKNIKEVDSDLYKYGINPKMEKYANKVLTISRVKSEGFIPEDVRYFMKEDGEYWVWSLSMFIGLADNIKDGFIDLSLIV